MLRPQDAVRRMDQLVESLPRCRAHPERVEIEPRRLLVEQAQHDALAMPRRQRRYAHVDRAPADAQRDAAILR